MGYDRNTAPTPHPGLRLLPWENDTGKPCFLSGDKHGGTLSRLADDIEAAQLCDGADVLDSARAALDGHEATAYQLRLTLRAVTQALGDVLRIADSRGARLPKADDYQDDDGEGSG